MSLNYLIRKSRLNDMKSVESAHRRSIIELCSKDYSSSQIDKFSKVRWEISINSDFHYLVELNNKVEGFCHCKIHDERKGEILGLYLSHLVVEKGIGRELIESAISFLKSKGITLVVLTATVTAKGFYQKVGFSVVKEKKISLRGIELECFDMEMSL